MKNSFKSFLTLETVLGCYIGAIGYGTGLNVPKYYGAKPIVCIICCLALGILFDFIANKILSSKFYNESKNNKLAVASFIYITYLAAWVIIDYAIDYDLDLDFLLDVGLVICIQMILIVIKYIKSKLKK